MYLIVPAVGLLYHRNLAGLLDNIVDLRVDRPIVICCKIKIRLEDNLNPKLNGTVEKGGGEAVR